MADFHQTGVITSLHRLGKPDLPRLERELMHYAEERPIALVLPSLYSEIHGPALKRIVEELIQVPYLTQCVLSLSGPAGPAEYRKFRELVEPIRSMDDEPATVIWNQGPRIQALIQRLRDEGLDPGSEGKGRANWLAYGYVLATHRARVVATHDCDILDYDRDLLARLVFPTANPNMSYEFAKGYYSRVSDRMHGRVTRLFMTPLIRAMKSVLGRAAPDIRGRASKHSSSGSVTRASIPAAKARGARIGSPMAMSLRPTERESSRRTTATSSTTTATFSRGSSFRPRTPI